MSRRTIADQRPLLSFSRDENVMGSLFRDLDVPLDRIRRQTNGINSQQHRAFGDLIRVTLRSSGCCSATVVSADTGLKWIVNAATGELLREPILGPNRDYQPTGAPTGAARRSRNDEHPDLQPQVWASPVSCETSHGRADRI